MEKILFALSSDGISTYRVVFRRDDGRLFVQCSCPAGEKGKLCRHKLGLLSGNKEMLSDPSQGNALKEIESWVRGGRLANLIRQLMEAETELEAAKKKHSDIKHEIEQAASHGI